MELAPQPANGAGESIQVAIQLGNRRILRRSCGNHGMLRRLTRTPPVHDRDLAREAVFWQCTAQPEDYLFGSPKIAALSKKQDLTRTRVHPPHCIIRSSLSRKTSAIIAYHSLDDSSSKISTSPVLFRAHLEALVSGNFKVVPLASILDNPGCIAITFDDGYRNFLKVAAPLLSEYRIPATVFVVSGYCGRYNEWPSRLKKLPRLETLSWAEVREISQAGFAIGAHTVNHLNLTTLPAKLAAQELRDCRSDLEDRIGLSVDTLAYPYGTTSAGVREIAKREFRLACGARPQFVGPASDPFDLPRIDAGYLRKLYWLSKLDTRLGAAYVATQRRVSGVRAILAKLG